MSYISYAMGWVLARLSDLFGNHFALSVLAFTVLVNIILLPLTMKTQKSTAKQAKLKPKLDALKKKYGNDKQKYSQAMNELYTKENVSMSGGCLPMVLRLLIMMGVYWAVASPFTYVMQIDTSAVKSVKEWVAYEKVAEDQSIDWEAAGLDEMMTSDAVKANAEKYGDGSEDSVRHYAKLAIVNTTALKGSDSIAKDSVEEKIKSAVEKSKVVREVEITKYLSTDADGKYSYPMIVDIFIKNGGDFDKINATNFDLFGINLTDTPEFSWNFSEFQVIWFIPIMSFVTSVLTSIVSMNIQKKANPDTPSMGGMMLFMPIISLVIAFGVPGAVGFYWACSNLISGGLQIVMQMVYGPAVIIAKDQGKSIVARAKKEQERIASRAAQENGGKEA